MAWGHFVAQTFTNKGGQSIRVSVVERSMKQNVSMVNMIDPVCKMEHIGLGKRMRLGDKWFTAGNCHHNATTCYGGK